MLQVRGLPLEARQPPELLEARCPADLLQDPHAVGRAPAQSCAHDVGIVAKALLHGIRVEPVIGQEKANPRRGRRADSRVERRGKALPLLGEHPHTPVLPTQLAQLPDRRRSRARRGDHDRFDGRGLGAGRHDALPQPVPPLVQDGDDHRGLVRHATPFHDPRGLVRRPRTRSARAPTLPAARRRRIRRLP